MGLKPDYRNFDSIKDICVILKINPSWVLLTNNPYKIEKFTKIGMDIKAIENLEMKVNPFSVLYLKYKQESGHQLKGVQKE